MLCILFFSSLIAYSQAATYCPPEGEFGPPGILPCPPTATLTTDGVCCVTALVLQLTEAAGATTVQFTGTGSTSISSITTIAGNTVAGGIGSTGCVDLVNPSTGVSDCPARAALCNDPTYYTVMTQQCPKTCQRCITRTGTSSTCKDLINPNTGVSDCTSLSNLCNDANYQSIMTVQCPKTCGRCSSTSSSTVGSSTGSCVDKINPNTGISDCPNRLSLCTHPTYTTLMRTQCPLSCGFCSSGATVTSSVTASTVSSLTGTCVDKINPNTGTSDCSAKQSLCTNAAYTSLMRVQCPLTCGFCTSG